MKCDRNKVHIRKTDRGTPDARLKRSLWRHRHIPREGYVGRLIVRKIRLTQAHHSMINMCTCIYLYVYTFSIFLGHVLWGPKRNLNWRVLRSPWFAKVSRSCGALELVDLHIGLLPAVMDSKQTTALYLAKGTLGVVTCKFTTTSFFASYAPDKVVEVCEGNTSWNQRVTDWMSVYYTHVIRLHNDFCTSKNRPFIATSG